MTSYVAQRALVPAVKPARPAAPHFPCLGTPILHRDHTLDTAMNLLYPVACSSPECLSRNTVPQPLEANRKPLFTLLRPIFAAP